MSSCYQTVQKEALPTHHVVTGLTRMDNHPPTPERSFIWKIRNRIREEFI